MPAKNGVVDENFGTDLPESDNPDPDMTELRRAANFTQTKEWKAQKAWVESRIAYYQHFLPGQVPAENVPDEERGKYWAVANIIVQEFQTFIDMYENAAELLKESDG